MLSTLGFDSKGTSRTTRNSSKYTLEVPRGFSVHVFKNPNPLSHTPSSKPADNHSRTPPSNVAWPISTTPSSRSDSQRKHSLSVPQDTRGTLSTHATPFDPKRSKSRPYGIYPSAIADTYIYERSMSSASDILASADSSSSSDESDLTESVVSLNIEISSTRASSSTETLDSTLAPSPPQTPRRIEATPPRPSTSSAIPPTPVPATELVRIRSQSPTSGRLNTQTSHSPPSNLRRRPTVETVSDDDSETVVSEEGREIDRLPGDASGGSSVRPTSGTAPRRSPQPEVLTPVSRSPNDRLPAHPRIREAVAISRSSSRHANLSPVEYRGMSGSPPYDDPSLRTPPGLNGISNPVPPATSVRNSSSSSPHNHHLAPLHIGGLVESTVTISARRCVRWNDNLVCPSPIPRSQRRKGWYNCRGDQLWTNDGQYKTPGNGEEYPPHLAGYPEPNAGWMNEEGIRIDMEHRLIPRRPLRSALKRPSISTHVPDQLQPNLITPTRSR